MLNKVQHIEPDDQDLVVKTLAEVATFSHSESFRCFFFFFLKSLPNHQLDEAMTPLLHISLRASSDTVSRA